MTPPIPLSTSTTTPITQSFTLSFSSIIILIIIFSIIPSPIFGQPNTDTSVPHNQRDDYTNYAFFASIGPQTEKNSILILNHLQPVYATVSITFSTPTTNINNVFYFKYPRNALETASSFVNCTNGVAFAFLPDEDVYTIQYNHSTIPIQSPVTTILCHFQYKNFTELINEAYHPQSSLTPWYSNKATFTGNQTDMFGTSVPDNPDVIDSPSRVYQDLYSLESITVFRYRLGQLRPNSNSTEKFLIATTTMLTPKTYNAVEVVPSVFSIYSVEDVSYPPPVLWFIYRPLSVTRQITTLHFVFCGNNTSKMTDYNRLILLQREKNLQAKKGIESYDTSPGYVEYTKDDENNNAPDYDDDFHNSDQYHTFYNQFSDIHASPDPIRPNDSNNQSNSRLLANRDVRPYLAYAIDIPFKFTIPHKRPILCDTNVSFSFSLIEKRIQILFFGMDLSFLKLPETPKSPVNPQDEDIQGYDHFGDIMNVSQLNDNTQYANDEPLSRLGFLSDLHCAVNIIPLEDATNSNIILYSVNVTNPELLELLSKDSVLFPQKNDTHVKYTDSTGKTFYSDQQCDKLPSIDPNLVDTVQDDSQIELLRRAHRVKIYTIMRDIDLLQDARDALVQSDTAQKDQDGILRKSLPNEAPSTTLVYNKAIQVAINTMSYNTIDLSPLNTPIYLDYGQSMPLHEKHQKVGQIFTRWDWGVTFTTALSMTPQCHNTSSIIPVGDRDSFISKYGTNDIGTINDDQDLIKITGCQVYSQEFLPHVNFSSLLYHTNTSRQVFYCASQSDQFSLPVTIALTFSPLEYSYPVVNISDFPRYTHLRIFSSSPLLKHTKCILNDMFQYPRAIDPNAFSLSTNFFAPTHKAYARISYLQPTDRISYPSALSIASQYQYSPFIAVSLDKRNSRLQFDIFTNYGAKAVTLTLQPTLLLKRSISSRIDDYTGNEYQLDAVCGEMDENSSYILFNYHDSIAVGGRTQYYERIYPFINRHDNYLFHYSVDTNQHNYISSCRYCFPMDRVYTLFQQEPLFYAKNDFSLFSTTKPVMIPSFINHLYPNQLLPPPHQRIFSDGVLHMGRTTQNLRYSDIFSDFSRASARLTVANPSTCTNRGQCNILFSYTPPQKFRDFQSIYNSLPSKEDPPIISVTGQFPHLLAESQVYMCLPFQNMTYSTQEYAMFRHYYFGSLGTNYDPSMPAYQQHRVSQLNPLPPPRVMIRPNGAFVITIPQPFEPILCGFFAHSPLTQSMRGVEELARGKAARNSEVITQIIDEFTRSLNEQYNVTDKTPVKFGQTNGYDDYNINQLRHRDFAVPTGDLSRELPEVFQPSIYPSEQQLNIIFTSSSHVKVAATAKSDQVRPRNITPTQSHTELVGDHIFSFIQSVAITIPQQKSINAEYDVPALTIIPADRIQVHVIPPAWPYSPSVEFFGMYSLIIQGFPLKLDTDTPDNIQEQFNTEQNQITIKFGFPLDPSLHSGTGYVPYFTPTNPQTWDISGDELTCKHHQNEAALMTHVNNNMTLMETSPSNICTDENQSPIGYWLYDRPTHTAKLIFFSRENSHGTPRMKRKPASIQCKMWILRRQQIDRPRGSLLWNSMPDPGQRDSDLDFIVELGNNPTVFTYFMRTSSDWILPNSFIQKLIIRNENRFMSQNNQQQPQLTFSQDGGHFDANNTSKNNSNYISCLGTFENVHIELSSPFLLSSSNYIKFVMLPFALTYFPRQQIVLPVPPTLSGSSIPTSCTSIFQQSTQYRNIWNTNSDDNSLTRDDSAVQATYYYHPNGHFVIDISQESPPTQSLVCFISFKFTKPGWVLPLYDISEYVDTLPPKQEPIIRAMMTGNDLDTITSPSHIHPQIPEIRQEYNHVTTISVLPLFSEKYVYVSIPQVSVTLVSTESRLARSINDIISPLQPLFTEESDKARWGPTGQLSNSYENNLSALCVAGFSCDLLLSIKNQHEDIRPTPETPNLSGKTVNSPEFGSDLGKTDEKTSFLDLQHTMFLVSLSFPSDIQIPDLICVDVKNASLSYPITISTMPFYKQTNITATLPDTCHCRISFIIHSIIESPFLKVSLQPQSFLSHRQLGADKSPIHYHLPIPPLRHVTTKFIYIPATIDQKNFIPFMTANMFDRQDEYQADLNPLAIAIIPHTRLLPHSIVDFRLKFDPKVYYIGLPQDPSNFTANSINGFELCTYYYWKSSLSNTFSKLFYLHYFPQSNPPTTTHPQTTTLPPGFPSIPFPSTPTHLSKLPPLRRFNPPSSLESTIVIVTQYTNPGNCRQGSVSISAPTTFAPQVFSSLPCTFETFPPSSLSMTKKTNSTQSFANNTNVRTFLGPSGMADFNRVILPNEAIHVEFNVNVSLTSLNNLILELGSRYELLSTPRCYDSLNHRHLQQLRKMITEQYVSQVLKPSKSIDSFKQDRISDRSCENSLHTRVIPPNDEMISPEPCFNTTANTWINYDGRRYPPLQSDFFSPPSRTISVYTVEMHVLGNAIGCNTHRAAAATPRPHISQAPEQSLYKSNGTSLKTSASTQNSFSSEYERISSIDSYCDYAPLITTHNLAIRDAFTTSTDQLVNFQAKLFSQSPQICSMTNITFVLLTEAEQGIHCEFDMKYVDHLPFDDTYGPKINIFARKTQKTNLTSPIIPDERVIHPPNRSLYISTTRQLLNLSPQLKRKTLPFVITRCTDTPISEIIPLYATNNFDFTNFNWYYCTNVRFNQYQHCPSVNVDITEKNELFLGERLPDEEGFPTPRSLSDCDQGYHYSADPRTTMCVVYHDEVDDRTISPCSAFKDSWDKGITNITDPSELPSLVPSNDYLTLTDHKYIDITIQPRLYSYYLSIPYLRPYLMRICTVCQFVLQCHCLGLRCDCANPCSSVILGCSAFDITYSCEVKTSQLYAYNEDNNPTTPALPYLENSTFTNPVNNNFHRYRTIQEIFPTKIHSIDLYPSSPSPFPNREQDNIFLTDSLISTAPEISSSPSVSAVYHLHQRLQLSTCANPCKLPQRTIQCFHDLSCTQEQCNGKPCPECIDLKCLRWRCTNYRIPAFDSDQTASISREPLIIPSNQQNSEVFSHVSVFSLTGGPDTPVRKNNAVITDTITIAENHPNFRAILQSIITNSTELMPTEPVNYDSFVQSSHGFFVDPPPVIVYTNHRPFLQRHFTDCTKCNHGCSSSQPTKRSVSCHIQLDYHQVSSSLPAAPSSLRGNRGRYSHRPNEHKRTAGGAPPVSIIKTHTLFKITDEQNCTRASQTPSTSLSPTRHRTPGTQVATILQPKPLPECFAYTRCTCYCPYENQRAIENPILYNGALKFTNATLRRAPQNSCCSYMCTTSLQQDGSFDHCSPNHFRFVDELYENTWRTVDVPNTVSPPDVQPTDPDPLFKSSPNITSTRSATGNHRMLTNIHISAARQIAKCQIRESSYLIPKLPSLGYNPLDSRDFLPTYSPTHADDDFPSLFNHIYPGREGLSNIEMYRNNPPESPMLTRSPSHSHGSRNGTSSMQDKEPQSPLTPLEEAAIRVDLENRITAMSYPIDIRTVKCGRLVDDVFILSTNPLVDCFMGFPSPAPGKTQYYIPPDLPTIPLMYNEASEEHTFSADGIMASLLQSTKSMLTAQQALITASRNIQMAIESDFKTALPIPEPPSVRLSGLCATTFLSFDCFVNLPTFQGNGNTSKPNNEAFLSDLHLADNPTRLLRNEVYHVGDTIHCRFRYVGEGYRDFTVELHSPDNNNSTYTLQYFNVQQRSVVFKIPPIQTMKYTLKVRQIDDKQGVDVMTLSSFYIISPCDLPNTQYYDIETNTTTYYTPETIQYKVLKQFSTQRAFTTEQYIWQSRSICLTPKHGYCNPVSLQCDCVEPYYGPRCMFSFCEQCDQRYNRKRNEHQLEMIKFVDQFVATGSSSDDLDAIMSLEEIHHFLKQYFIYAQLTTPPSQYESSVHQLPPMISGVPFDVFALKQFSYYSDQHILIEQQALPRCFVDIDSYITCACKPEQVFRLKANALLLKQPQQDLNEPTSEDYETAFNKDPLIDYSKYEPIDAFYHSRRYCQSHPTCISRSRCAHGGFIAFNKTTQQCAKKCSCPSLNNFWANSPDHYLQQFSSLPQQPNKSPPKGCTECPLKCPMLSINPENLAIQHTSRRTLLERLNSTLSRREHDARCQYCVCREGFSEATGCRCAASTFSVYFVDPPFIIPETRVLPQETNAKLAVFISHIIYQVSMETEINMRHFHFLRYHQHVNRKKGDSANANKDKNNPTTNSTSPQGKNLQTELEIVFEVTDFCAEPPSPTDLIIFPNNAVLTQRQLRTRFNLFQQQFIISRALLVTGPQLPSPDYLRTYIKSVLYKLPTFGEMAVDHPSHNRDDTFDAFVEEVKEPIWYTTSKKLEKSRESGLPDNLVQINENLLINERFIFDALPMTEISSYATSLLPYVLTSFAPIDSTPISTTQQSAPPTMTTMSLSTLAEIPKTIVSTFSSLFYPSTGDKSPQMTSKNHKKTLNVTDEEVRDDQTLKMNKASFKQQSQTSEKSKYERPTIELNDININPRRSRTLAKLEQLLQQLEKYGQSDAGSLEQSAYLTASLNTTHNKVVHDAAMLSKIQSQLSRLNQEHELENRDIFNDDDHLDLDKQNSVHHFTSFRSNSGKQKMSGVSSHVNTELDPTLKSRSRSHQPHKPFKNPQTTNSAQRLVYLDVFNTSPYQTPTNNTLLTMLTEHFANNYLYQAELDQSTSLQQLVTEANADQNRIIPILPAYYGPIQAMELPLRTFQRMNQTFAKLYNTQLIHISPISSYCNLDLDEDCENHPAVAKMWSDENTSEKGATQLSTGFNLAGISWIVMITIIPISISLIH